MEVGKKKVIVASNNADVPAPHPFRRATSFTYLVAARSLKRAARRTTLPSRPNILSSNKGTLPQKLPKPTIIPVRKIESATSATGKVGESCKQKGDFIYKKEGWMDIAHTKSTRCVVTEAYKTNFSLKDLPPDATLQMPDKFKVPIEPGKMYKFRVAAINSLGVGPWSPPAVFHTPKPNLTRPQAPHSAVGKRTAGGIELSWQVPLNHSDCNISGYLVSLSVKYKIERQSCSDPDSNIKLALQRVYCGRNPNCVISYEKFREAKIDHDCEKRGYFTFMIFAMNDASKPGPHLQIYILEKGMKLQNIIN